MVDEDFMPARSSPFNFVSARRQMCQATGFTSSFFEHLCGREEAELNYRPWFST